MSDPHQPRPVLILGGTGEARRLAEALLAPHWKAAPLRPILSLAGATERPLATLAEARSGGFGGAEGLASYLRAQQIAALIDATHPFAERISRNAIAAARVAAVPLLRLERPAWTPEPGEVWREVEDLAAAATLPPPGARLFLAIGPGGAAPFAKRADLWCALRRIEPTSEPFPLPQGEWVVGRPPFTEAAEAELFARLGVAWLVAKNSGGDRAKLRAARRLGLEVAMVRRPPPPEAVQRAETVDEAIDWLRRQFVNRS